MPAFLILAACCAAPIAAGAVALVVSLKKGPDKFEKPALEKVPSNRFTKFRGLSKSVEEKVK